MRVFKVKYKHAWCRSWQYAYVAAEDFESAKKKVKKEVAENWDVAEYFNFEFCIEKFEPMDVTFVLNELRSHVSQSKIDNYCIKDIIE